MYDGTNSFSTDNSPDEERHSSRRHEERFDREQVSDLVDWGVDEWEGTQPKEDERHEMDGVRSRIGDGVWDTAILLVLLAGHLNAEATNIHSASYSR